MKPILIKGTLKTPMVKLDPVKGLFEFRGRSTPTHSVDFFKPIMDWIDDYVKKPGDRTTVNVHFEHFNTSSSMFLLDIFNALEELHRETHNVEVNWYYDHGDESIHTAGKDYDVLINIPFNLIEVPE